MGGKPKLGVLGVENKLKEVTNSLRNEYKTQNFAPGPTYSYVHYIAQLGQNRCIWENKAYLYQTEVYIGVLNIFVNQTIS